jgi:adenosylcobinamide kinase / adenosylcobinamide-phosphate guanylyltransferase
VILLDCLTLLVSNVVLQDDCTADQAEQRMQTEIQAILNVLAETETTLIIVSGEVGMGVVPETPLGRLFRDLLGWSNQTLARHAHATYFMLAGHALNTTRLNSTVHQAAQELTN